MDWRESRGSRENTQHLWKRTLWLAAVYAHIWLIQVFLQHALIVNTDLFFSVPCSVLSAGITQRVGCFQEPSFPGPKATQNLGGQCKQRLGNLGAWGSRAARLAHPSPRKNQTGLGAAGHSRPSKSTFLLCCNHNKVCSTSGTHNKTFQLLEIKSNRVCSLAPQTLGRPSGAGMLCQSKAWFLCFDGRAEGEEVGRRAHWQPCSSHLLPWRIAGGQF